MNKLMISSFISLFYLLNCLPSEDIWKKVIEYNDTNLMVINDTNYFIFQEKNYCNKDIYSEEMQVLYNKQKSFFEKRGTANYIFVVDNFDENKESIKDGAFHLSQYLYNEFNAKMEKSIIALFSIETRRLRIRTGEITKESITDSESEEIISSLGDLLRGKDYYNAFILYYDKLEYYIDTNSMIFSDYFLYCFFGAIFAFIVFYVGKMLIYEQCKKCYYLPDDDNLIKIVSFLKLQKTNKKIFTENCIICLSSLK